MWSRLAEPFPPEAVEWRVTRVLDEGSAVQVRPQLKATAVKERLDEICGRVGWSSEIAPIGVDALVCNLKVQEVSKAKVVALESWQVGLGPERRAEDALVYAAEAFGMRPSADTEAVYESEQNPETGELLYEPELMQAAADSSPPEAPKKPEGQQAIDKLIERLKAQGRGLEVAKLVIEHGGYGENPETARELYGKLRLLLAEAPSVNS